MTLLIDCAVVCALRAPCFFVIYVMDLLFTSSRASQGSHVKGNFRVCLTLINPKLAQEYGRPLHSLPLAFEWDTLTTMLYGQGYVNRIRVYI